MSDWTGNRACRSFQVDKGRRIVQICLLKGAFCVDPSSKVCSLCYLAESPQLIKSVALMVWEEKKYVFIKF